MNVRLELEEIPEEQVYSLAQYLKRMTFDDAKAHTLSEGEAHDVIYAVEKLRDALDLEGYAVR